MLLKCGLLFYLNFLPVSSDAPQAESEGYEPSDVPISKTPEDMVAWWNAAIKDYDAMFLVFYRGLW